MQVKHFVIDHEIDSTFHLYLPKCGDCNIVTMDHIYERAFQAL